MSWTIRSATEADAADCAAIYAPYVTETAITFEIEPPDVAEMGQRIATAAATHAWLVLEEAGVVVGYAYGRPFHQRAAYRWACETSIYLGMNRRRTGAGRALYSALLDRLVERGCRRALGGMTLPNEGSAGLHRALGFTRSGCTETSDGSTACGTTWPGCRRPSRTRPTHRPNRTDASPRSA